MKLALSTVALALALAFPGPARAQGDAGTGAAIAGTDQAPQQFGISPTGPHLGAAVLLGGGVESFSRANARSVTSPGGFWSARLMWGTRHLVGAEAAYVGSAQSLNALGMSDNAWLVSNGLEGLLRLNLPVVRGAMLFEPFVLGGVGWSLYEVARTTSTADVAANDSILAVPFGGGFAFGYHAFMVDARFTYRATFFNDLFRTTDAALDNWSMGALVGIQF
jgi:hypothetical protein